MITRVQRVIHSQFIALHISEPHPERRSNDGQAILKAIGGGLKIMH